MSYPARLYTPEPAVPITRQTSAESRGRSRSKVTGNATSRVGSAKSRGAFTFFEDEGLSSSNKRLYKSSSVTELDNLIRLKRRAAEIISRVWRRYHDHKVYTSLKAILQKAETSLTHEVLRKLSPQEAEVLKDKVHQARIRFRLGGESWPPVIYFKIFTKSAGVQYYSGMRVIAPGTQAARDSCNVMGSRAFIENVIMAENHISSYKIGEAYEVTNRLDYIQYMNSLDTRPAYLGGRNNGWRELSALPLGHQMVLFDSVKTGQDAVDTWNVRVLGLNNAILRKPTPLPAMYTIEETKARKRKQKLDRLKKLYNIHDNREISPSGQSEQSASEYPNDVQDEEFDQLYEWANNLSLDNIGHDLAHQESVFFNAPD